MKLKKQGLKLLKNGTKLKISNKGENYTIYSNNNVNYYKFIKLCFEKDIGVLNYDFKSIKNYNSFEIELAILILETDSLEKQEKIDDFSFLKIYNEKEKNGYYKILKTEKNKLKELEIEYKKEIKSLDEKLKK